MDEEKTRLLAQLKNFADISSVINSSLEINDIIERSMSAAQSLVGASASSVLFIDEKSGQLYFNVATGDKSDSVKEIRLNKGQGIAGWVAENNQPLIVNDAQNDARLFKNADEKSGFETRNILCVPINTKKKQIGVLQIINKLDSDFNTYDLNLMTSLSNQIAVAIENARLFEELRSTFFSTMYALAVTMDKRDPFTAGHLENVCRHSLLIGKELGLSSGEMVSLKIAALMHDIGMIGIRDELLNKNSKLTLHEHKEVMQHALHGAEIIANIKQLSYIVPVVRHHHERFDGQGFPDGLSGEKIPLHARIIALADSFDAMTSNRPYRKSLSYDWAIAEIKRESGTQFDPALVDIYVKILSTER